MNLLSWLPFGRKAENSSPVDAKMRGPLTGCNLSDLSPLMRPFRQDPFYRLRPPFSPEAAQMSIELADTAYTLDLDAWKAAGWNDFSILIDDSLQSGMDHGGVSSRFKLFKAKAALREYNPLSQLAGAMRQREKSDTIKAVCMMRPDGEGRWLTAIGFMGTGKRFYDWISNLRFTQDEGFHRGFYQLCESFELNAEEIVFPAAAEALGLEKLTLGEVFTEMRSLSSRFRLWMAGHSQGGAVMQVLTHRLMNDWGVLAQNMVGYSFGSPTVTSGRFVYDPAAYPLYHLINRDDIVPRMGALMHLGLCLEYRPDDAFRKRIYGLNMKQESIDLRADFRFIEEGMQDMPSALMYLSALVEVLAQEKGAEGMNELLTSWWAVPAVDRVLWRAGDKALDQLDRLLGSAGETYQVLTGKPMDEQELGRLRQRMRPLVQKLPLRRLIDVLNDYGVVPHRLGDAASSAYTAMVLDHLEELHPFIWIKASAGLPVRRYGSWDDAGDWPEISTPAFAHRRRSRLRPPAVRGRMRLAYSTLRRV